MHRCLVALSSRLCGLRGSRQRRCVSSPKPRRQGPQNRGRGGSPSPGPDPGGGSNDAGACHCFTAFTDPEQLMPGPRRPAGAPGLATGTAAPVFRPAVRIMIVVMPPGPGAAAAAAARLGSTQCRVTSPARAGDSAARARAGPGSRLPRSHGHGNTDRRTRHVSESSAVTVRASHGDIGRDPRRRGGRPRRRRSS